MTAAKDIPLRIWVVTDGRAGIVNQAHGLAEAIGRRLPCDIKLITIPHPFLIVPNKAKKPTADMTKPWPDVWIGCGRASLPYSASVREWSGHKTFVVQLQNPRRDLSLYDMVIAPKHDEIKGKNVLSITGATNRIHPSLLADAEERFEKALSALPKPRLAVLIGGNSHRHKLTGKLAKQLLSQLQALAKRDVGLMISTSRRTPAHAVKLLKSNLRGKENVWFWSGEKDGPNPYFAFLAGADAVVVTSDSSNLLSETASAGKPILLFRLHGEDGRFDALFQDLMKRDILREFDGEMRHWHVDAMLETEHAAEAVLRHLHTHLKAAR